jgi:hypothetical protein
VTTHEDSPQRTLRTPSQPFSASAAHSAVEIVEPDTAEELAAALQRASNARQSIVIRGAQPRAASRTAATVEASGRDARGCERGARAARAVCRSAPFADRATIGGI